MGLKEFFDLLLNRERKVKRIADPITISEPGDGDEQDLTSRAYYKSCVRQNRDEINRLSRYVQQYTEKFKEVQKQFSADSQEYNNARDEMYRWIVALDEVKGQEGFFRPNTKEDIAYRTEIFDTFPDKLKEVLSPNLDLRFHSTSISATKQILQTRQITSTPDRYDGYIRNSDGKGEISVSNRDDIVRTIRYYSRLGDYSNCLPSGCVFALFPKDKADASNHVRSVISSVDFRKNPEQLFGIFTTPENIKIVQQWMKDSQLNPDIVYTYEQFLNVVKYRAEVEDRKKQFKQEIVQPNYMNSDSTYIIPDPDLYPENNKKESYEHEQ